MNANAQHTPGPWQWVQGVEEDDLTRLVGAGGSEVCNFGNCEQFVEREGTEPNKANAHLIAAAPELYEVLEEAENTLSHADDCPYRHHGECLCIRSRVVAALAKARGKVRKVRHKPR